jgi:hypothetical protein
MSELWYYAEGYEKHGPVGFDQLIKHLSQLSTTRGILVWRKGLSGWTSAENVKEIVEKLVRPPPLPGTSPTKADQAKPSASDADTRRRRIAFVVVLVFVLLTGAYFASQIYDNSAEGIANLFGQLLGVWFLLSILSWWKRKETYTPAVVLAVSALFVVGSNLGKLQDAGAGREGMAALQGVTDPQQIDEALRQHPSNKFLQMMAIAREASNETGAAAKKLQDEIEPPSLTKDFDPRTASRDEPEGLRRDFQTAQSNASAFMPRYLVLLKAEHDKVEGQASSNVSKDLVTNLLSGVDRRNAKAAAFTSKMMSARTEFYDAYANYLSFLIGQSGTYKVVNGQFIFPQQSTADRFNAVAGTVTATAKRVADLEVERKSLLQSQQEGWERFVKGK